MLCVSIYSHKITLKVVNPRLSPRSLQVTEIVPPCFSAIDLAMARPRPNPPVSEERDLSVR